MSLFILRYSHHPTLETAIAVELNNKFARSSSVIASLLRFGERIRNSRRPYQWDKYLRSLRYSSNIRL